jgi:hypothetical protein
MLRRQSMVLEPLKGCLPVSSYRAMQPRAHTSTAEE